MPDITRKDRVREWVCLFCKERYFYQRECIKHILKGHKDELMISEYMARG